MIEYNLEQIWSSLEAEAVSEGTVGCRKYRRLDLDCERGIRLGYVMPERILEMLIQISIKEEDVDIVAPNWKGMRFEIIALDIPEEHSKHIRLFLINLEYKSIFINVCTDLVKSLNKLHTAEKRKKEIETFLWRWSRFFERYGNGGLTPEKQQGLLGELWWLQCLINFNIDKYSAVSAWKGCSRDYYDFELEGNIVEVKTTKTKEPRKVVINNENQLDDQDGESLHLFVLTLRKLNDGGVSLPGLVNQIRTSLVGYETAESAFEHSLIDAGYLDMHASDYSIEYIVKKEELFVVKHGFPRLVQIPSGLGDLKYSLMVSACKNFEIDRDIYLKELLKIINDNS